MMMIRAANRLARIATLAAAALAAIAALPAAATATRPNGPSTALVGEWQGRSLCVTTNRPACTDETVRYRVRKDAPAGEAFHVGMDKLVSGQYEAMGIELACTFEVSRQQLICPVTGGQWQLRWDGDALFGALIDARTGMFRAVSVHRVETVAPVAPPTAAAATPARTSSPTSALVTVPWPFEADIAAFEAADRALPPAPGGVVFIGSSSIRMWPDVAADFPGMHAVNRGFGGSTMADAVRAAPRILVPRQPRIAVLYSGENDLNAGTSPQQILADYRAFAAIVHRDSPKTRIVVVSIKPSPSRWALVEQMRATNALLRTEVARDPRARFVDVFTPMLGPDGRPRPELYIADQLHMTPAGYAIWRARIAPALR